MLSENRPPLSPHREQLRMNAQTHRLAEREQPLPKVRTLAQIAKGSLPRNNFFNTCRIQQPGRQGLLARSSTRRTEQLKKRSSPKQVEITRVRMRGIKKTLPRFTRPRPPILDPCQSSLIKTSRPSAKPNRLQNSLMQNGQKDEQRKRNQEELKNRHPMNEHRRAQDCCDTKRHLGISQQALTLPFCCLRQVQLVQPLGIDFLRALTAELCLTRIHSLLHHRSSSIAVIAEQLIRHNAQPNPAASMQHESGSRFPERVSTELSLETARQKAGSADFLPILFLRHALVVAHVVALPPEDHVFCNVRGVVGHALQCTRNHQGVQSLRSDVALLLHHLRQSLVRSEEHT